MTCLLCLVSDYWKPQLKVTNCRSFSALTYDLDGAPIDGVLMYVCKRHPKLSENGLNGLLQACKSSVWWALPSEVWAHIMDGVPQKDP